MMAKKTPHRCHETREMMYNYRRNELSELDAAIFEDAMAQCPECRQYVGRLIEMLNLAQSSPVESFIDHKVDATYADDLFSSITSQIEETQQENVIHIQDVRDQREGRPVTGELPSMNLAQNDDDDEFDTPDISNKTGRLVLFALVATLVVGLGLALMWNSSETDPLVSPTPEVATKEVEPPQQQEEPLKQEEPAPPEVKLASATPNNKAVRIFPTPGAKWQLTHKKNTHTLKIEKGTLLVEFVPNNPSKDSLKVVTKNAEVQVLGTLFYVSTQDQKSKAPQVGVLTGKVQVKTEAHGSFTLSDAQEVVLDEAPKVEEMPLRTKSQWTKVVSVEGHQAALKAAKEKAKLSAKPTPKKVTPAVDVAALRSQAKSALADRRYTDGAQAYEQLLRALPSRSAERATIRLELVRLYMRHLRQGDRAIRHLRTFIQKHPKDVATPSAKRQLCRLLGAKAPKDPLCSP